MKNRQLFYPLLVLSFLGIIGFSYIFGRLLITGCDQWSVASSKGAKYYTHPEKVEVQPWHGRHHVYAIFMIPGGYLNDKIFTITIQGAGTYCGVVDFGGARVAEGVYAEPGNYLMKGLLNTRTALRLISQGKGDQLKQPVNWRLGYTKMEEKGNW